MLSNIALFFLIQELEFLTFARMLQMSSLISMRSYACHQCSQHCCEWLSVSSCSLQRGVLGRRMVQLSRKVDYYLLEKW